MCACGHGWLAHILGKCTLCKCKEWRPVPKERPVFGSIKKVVGAKPKPQPPEWD